MMSFRTRMVLGGLFGYAVAMTVQFFPLLGFDPSTEGP